MREAIARLGPWHHDIEVAPGVWTKAVSEEIRGREQLIGAGLEQVSHRPVEHAEGILRSVYPDGLDGRSVLDCACNAGGHLFGAVKAGAGSGLGFDAREHWIAQARFLSQHLPADGLRFEVCELDDLPSLGVGQFDVCFFNGILYHLPDPVAGLRIAADHARELLILNTSTTAGRAKILTLSKESEKALMSGVDRLAWLPTTEVLKPILQWCGFPHIHVRMQVAQAVASPRGWGRVELVAARQASTLENLERRRAITRRLSPARRRLRGRSRSPAMTGEGASASLEQELKALVARWCKAVVDKDIAAADELRDPGYRAELPDGRVLTKKQELELIGFDDLVVDSMRIADLELELKGGFATADFECTIDGCFGGVRTQTIHAMEVEFRQTESGWRARSSRTMLLDQPPPENLSRLAARLRLRIRPLLGHARRALTRDRSSTSHGLTYIPYRRGCDFALEATTGERPADLPVPPRELWLGYDYPTHGKGDVDAMLAAARDSGFELRDGDRILDFGCAAGRMIRHLEPLADRCEIWGADISAEHILWCKRHLSPPFHFLTSTVDPHLPFEDRSFRLVYAGSVFTHIDDLADAWLLELARILEPGGRLYVTIHDEHTIEQFEDGFWSSSPAAQAAKASEVYPRPGEQFDMFTVGRGPDSLVFYARDYFARQLPPAFEPLSFIPGAYSCQTAVLARRV